MIVEVRPAHAQLSDEELLGFGESNTAVQGSAPLSEKVRRTSGIVGAGESEKEIGVQPPPPMPSRAEMGLSEPPPPVEGSGSRRNFMIMALGAVLAIGGVAAGGVAWWANQGDPAQAVEARPQDVAETGTAAAEPENTVAAEPVVEKDTADTASPPPDQTAEKTDRDLQRERQVDQSERLARKLEREARQETTRVRFDNCILFIFCSATKIELPKTSPDEPKLGASAGAGDGVPLVRP